MRRLLLLVAVSVCSGALAWLTWPHPDVEIQVDRGGVATIVDRFGRQTPLGDTVFVGGGGARRTLRVVNRDTMTHRLAMFSAAAGDRRDYTVPIGVYGGYCSAHPSSKHLTFVVR